MDRTLGQLWANPGSISVMEMMLFITLTVILVTLLYVQVKRDAIDLRWLITDDLHRPSIHKIAQLTALVVSTWGFVVLILKGSISETYYIGYMVTWSGSVALDKYLSRDRRAGKREDDPEEAPK